MEGIRLETSGGEGGGRNGSTRGHFSLLGEWEAELIVEGEEDGVLYKVLLKVILKRSGRRFGSKWMK